MRGVVDCFGGGFEKIFSKPAPGVVEQEFGGLKCVKRPSHDKLKLANPSWSV